jgi:hypothetical protein
MATTPSEPVQRTKVPALTETGLEPNANLDRVISYEAPVSDAPGAQEETAELFVELVTEGVAVEPPADGVPAEPPGAGEGVDEAHPSSRALAKDQKTGGDARRRAAARFAAAACARTGKPTVAMAPGHSMGRAIA